ncbi:hypothetical protein HDU97_004801 [Phlyctochytrium planicorne]|nr:hypothetical protein HDU97_004801 [Phlyctochytrium planicorne]
MKNHRVRNGIDWLALALDHPLKHLPSGTQIHLVGVRPSSLDSISRMRSVITSIKPSIIALQCNRSRLDQCLSKLPSSASIDDILNTKTITPTSDIDSALQLSQNLSAPAFPIDIHPFAILNPETYELGNHLESIRMLYRAPRTPRVHTSSLGKFLFKTLHRTQLGDRMSGSPTSEDPTISDHKFARRLVGTFYPKDFSAVMLLREAILVDNIKRLVRKVVAEKGNNQTLVAVVNMIHAEGLFNTWNSYGRSFIIRPAALGGEDASAKVFEEPVVVKEKRMEGGFSMPEGEGIVVVGSAMADPNRLRVTATNPTISITLPTYMRPLGELNWMPSTATVLPKNLPRPLKANIPETAVPGARKVPPPPPLPPKPKGKPKHTPRKSDFQYIE